MVRADPQTPGVRDFREVCNVAHIQYRFKLRVVCLADLSERLRTVGVKGASGSNLQRIFKGERDPSYKVLKGLAEVRGTDLEEVGELLEHCRRQYTDFHSAK
jgi:transcriptional regulator with XRE-family HTH domain